MLLIEKVFCLKSIYSVLSFVKNDIWLLPVLTNEINLWTAIQLVCNIFECRNGWFGVTIYLFSSVKFSDSECEVVISLDCNNQSSFVIILISWCQCRIVNADFMWEYWGWGWLLRRLVCVCVSALSNLTNYNLAALSSMMILNLAAFLSLSHNLAAKQIFMLQN